MPKTITIKTALLLMFVSALSGCAHPSQNNYSYSEVGKSTAVSFGTVLAVRPIEIKGKNTGVGAAGGAAAGGLAMSHVGTGANNGIAILGGVAAGAIVGALAEQAISDRDGVEYTITLESGVTLTIAQEAPEDERIMQPGERVMVQNSGGYQRVLLAENLPTAIKRPKGVKVIDE